jgi:hypothetical protein
MKGNTRNEIGRYTWQQDGKLEDELGRKLTVEDIRAKAFVPEEPVSLMDKPLPSLEKLGAKLGPAQVGNKRILVCFWDMNQRPSRNCVHRLDRKARLLSGEGVFVVLVEAGSADDVALKDWVRKQKITLPIGRIREKVDEALRNWGVRSLPWLILTDKKHIVRAGGFGIEELDEIMKKSGGNNGED